MQHTIRRTIIIVLLVVHASGQPAGCPAGTANMEGTCVECPTGKYADMQTTSCVACAMGKFTPVAGRALCTACAPGTFGDIVGSSACQNCEAGTFQEYAGSTACNVATNANESDAGMRCGDIKQLYKDNACCGEPEKFIEFPSSERHLAASTHTRFARVQDDAALHAKVLKGEKKIEELEKEIKLLKGRLAQHEEI